MIEERARRWDLLSAGEIFIDLVLAELPRWPRPGEEVHARRMARELGGGCAITAAGAAALGLEVGLLACIGADEESWVRGRLAARHVDGHAVRVHEREPTAITVSISSPEDRAFLTYEGANLALPGLLAEEQTRALLDEARHLHLAGALAPAALVELAAATHRAGATISVDVGWREEWLADPESLHALREVDLFFPNEREAGLMTGEAEPEAMLRSLAASGLGRVGLKLGARGAALLWEGELALQPPLAVSAVDTTGAGDAFDAGFLAGWLGGRPPRVALRWGAICGALSTRALGGLAALPGRDELVTVIGEER